ncbi:host-nuclease inhibitor Gam family protein [Paenibacillus sp. P22]|uniref:host-nuclease inhibitor Gam family protein n=1 Tax=Paenibacillus sp. P22 TaxID=483908 RepID=UPI0004278171|nr:host-nuclease inhibitor Gam family protein [Paenibacillus sp. P22]
MNQLQAAELLDIEEIKEQPQRFSVNTVEEANWALRKLSAIEAKRNEIKALAEQEMKRIKQWLEWESTSLDDSTAYFNGLLSEYAYRQRDQDPKFKKFTTPYGSVAFKKQQDKWEYDDAALLDSLRSSGLTELIRVKEEPNKVELKKRVAVKDGLVVDPETGSVLEGVQVIVQPDKLVVEPRE